MIVEQKQHATVEQLYGTTCIRGEGQPRCGLCSGCHEHKLKMIEAYEERQKAKAKRLAIAASKLSDIGNSKVDSGMKSLDAIPFGQPILEGHYSESRDRNYRNKACNKIDKGFELIDKAKELQKKSFNIEHPTSISSDDPEAIDKLKAKLETMQKEREKIKSREHEPYELSNLSQNMIRVKKRIEYLEKANSTPSSEIQIGEVKIIDNVELNRLQMFFPGKPSEEIRTELKHNGFRWSPYNGCWQSFRSDRAMTISKEIAKKEEGK